MAQDRQSILDEMTFIDSWQDKSVQLLAGAALVAGTAGLVAKGQAPQVLRHGKDAFKHVQKNADRYLQRRLPKAGKIFYPMGKSIYKNVGKEMKGLKKQRRDQKDLTPDSYRQSKQKEFEDLNMKDVRQQAFNLRKQEKEKFEFDQFGKNNPAVYKEKPFEYYEEMAKQELIERKNGVNQPPKEKRPWLTKGQLQDAASNAAGAALAGTAFATGISIVHSFDDNKKAQKSYEVAGSFLKEDEPRRQGNRQSNHRQGQQQNRPNNQYRGYNNMNSNRPNHHGQNQYRQNQPKREYPQPSIQKQAGIRDVHEALLAGPAKKVGGAVLTGIGFGGVSYGMTEMNKKKQEQEAKNNKSRIIIELGDQTHDANNMDGGTGLIPRPNFSKQAGMANFLKNVGGRKGDLRTIDSKLENHDYTPDALANLQQKNVNSNNNPYRSHFSEEKANEYMLNQEIKRLKNSDITAKEHILDDVAKAQTQAIGGASLGIAGLAGLGAMNKKKEGEQA